MSKLLSINKSKNTILIKKITGVKEYHITDIANVFSSDLPKYKDEFLYKDDTDKIYRFNDSKGKKLFSLRSNENTEDLIQYLKENNIKVF